jgi:hypothetical protein
MLVARLPELQLGNVVDWRRAKGRRWGLSTLLTSLLVGILAGCRCLAQVEELTEELARPMRRRLHIHRRVPDTTLRSVASGVAPDELRFLLHRHVRAAHRRHALTPQHMPFGVVALDGKTITLPSVDDNYAQRQTHDGGRLTGALRTMTCTLITARGAPCLDAFPVRAPTNEMGTFLPCVHALLKAYGSLDLFRMVSADAGSCSEDNGREVRALGVHYLFGLKGTQLVLLTEARRQLGPAAQPTPLASSHDELGGGVVEERELYATSEMTGFQWDHLQTVLRVRRTRSERGKPVSTEDRYFVTSLPFTRLSPKQWLGLVRSHWAVETCHWTLDTVFLEDRHPWIEADPKAALAIALLRRLAYNLLSLYRSVTQRSAERRATPWRGLVRAVEKALTMVTEQQLEGLRIRSPPPGG